MALITSQAIEYKITNTHTDIINPAISLNVAQGYHDQVGNFIALRTFSVEVERGDVLRIFSTFGDPTKSLYVQLKEILYQYLIDRGIAEGTVA